MAPTPEERLATLEARLETLIRDRGELREAIREVQRDMKEMREDYKDVHDTIVAARGGWKAYAALGGFMMVIGAIIDRAVGWASKAF